MRQLSLSLGILLLVPACHILEPDRASGSLSDDLGQRLNSQLISERRAALEEVASGQHLEYLDGVRDLVKTDEHTREDRLIAAQTFATLDPAEAVRWGATELVQRETGLPPLVALRLLRLGLKHRDGRHALAASLNGDQQKVLRQVILDFVVNRQGVDLQLEAVIVSLVEGPLEQRAATISLLQEDKILISKGAMRIAQELPERERIELAQALREGWQTELSRPSRTAQQLETALSILESLESGPRHLMLMNSLTSSEPAERLAARRAILSDPDPLVDVVSTRIRDAEPADVYAMVSTLGELKLRALPPQSVDALREWLDSQPTPLSRTSEAIALAILNLMIHYDERSLRDGFDRLAGDSARLDEWLVLADVALFGLAQQDDNDTSQVSKIQKVSDPEVCSRLVQALTEQGHIDLVITLAESSPSKVLRHLALVHAHQEGRWSTSSLMSLKERWPAAWQEQSDVLWNAVSEDVR